MPDRRVLVSCALVLVAACSSRSRVEDIPEAGTDTPAAPAPTDTDVDDDLSTPPPAEDAGDLDGGTDGDANGNDGGDAGGDGGEACAGGTVEAEPNNTAPEAMPVQAGLYCGAVGEAADPVDVFYLPLAAGQRYTFDYAPRLRVRETPVPGGVLVDLRAPGNGLQRTPYRITFTVR